MNNKSTFNLRTDLIIEDPKYSSNKEIIDGIEISSSISNGIYTTIRINDIKESTYREKISNILEDKLKYIMEYHNIKEFDKCLVVGLGNRISTPDSLGPKVIDNIFITTPIIEMDKSIDNLRAVMAISPGVMGQTGIDSSLIIKSLVKSTDAKFLIVIDSLATSSIDNINKIIQITDTGIHPGSGIDNNRIEISDKTIGIPVIAIGIPTVTTSSIIVYDTIDYLFKYISYIKNNESTFLLSHNKWKKNKSNISEYTLSKEEENTLLGLFGTLNNQEKRKLINEVLTDIDLNLIVTPTEIDFIIDKLSNIISLSINHALNRNINNY